MQVDLIIHNAAQLITCASGGELKRGATMQDVGLIENGALAISSGEIVGVGTNNEIKQIFRAKEEIEAHGKVVMPGFVDCHTHIVFAGHRLDEFELKIKGVDYLEILARGGGIISTVEKTRNASFNQLCEESGKRLNEMLKNGTTTAEVKTGYGLDFESELKMLDAIAELDQTQPIDLIPTFLGAHAIPPEFKNTANEYVDFICDEMLPQAATWYRNSHFVQKQIEIFQAPLSTFYLFADVFCERNAFNLEQSRRVLEMAKKLGLQLKAHVDEFTNLGGARMAIELGAESIDHLDATSNEEINLLAASETVAVITPAVNFNFGNAHFADARKLIDTGCCLALSTDYNPGSAPCPGLPMAMAIACRYQKLLPSEAINAATINAAYAVGLGEKLGSLEIGKQADVLLLNTDDYRQVAYEFGSNFVQTIVKKGKIVVEN